MSRRMEARRIPGTGQIAIREWWGFAWGDWMVVDDPIYHHPRQEEGRGWDRGRWGSPAYRTAVDALPEPPAGTIPPLPVVQELDGFVDHRLKIDSRPFREILDGRKRFEWRGNDRYFEEGDVLELQEHQPGFRGRKIPTGEKVWVRVLYVMREGYGLPLGYVILSIEPIAVYGPLYPEFPE